MIYLIAALYVFSCIVVIKLVSGQIGTWSFRHLSTQSNRHLLKSAPRQFGTSVKNNFVIIKYLFIKKKEKKLDLLASTKYNL